MLIRLFLAVGVVAGVMGGPVAQLSAQCDYEVASTIGCPAAQAQGDRVIVSGSTTASGADSGQAVAPGSGGTHDPQLWTRPDPGRVCDSGSGSCLAPELPAEPVDPGFPEVTLADLVSFRPATPTLGGEPAGFGVVGMPANFVAGASEQQLAGVLLGYPVTVRFTPTAYVFSYGDGSTLRAASGGTSWEASGVAQFTSTSTSHVYAQRGTYATGVTIEYAAAVDFGTGWRPVDGVVTARSADYPVQVVEVRTALVDRTCIENPRGPGC